MKYGDLTLGQIEALVNKHGGMDGVARFLRGETRVEEGGISKILLLRKSRITVSHVPKKFAVAKYCKIETSDTSLDKISYMGDNFRNWFLPQIIAPRDGYNISRYDLAVDSSNGAIIKELGESYEVDIAAILHLMVIHNVGGTGDLLDNGQENIFYARDVNGRLRCVYVFWRATGWSMAAWAADDDSGLWAANRRVFSR